MSRQSSPVFDREFVHDVDLYSRFMDMYLSSIDLFLAQSRCDLLRRWGLGGLGVPTGCVWVSLLLCPMPKFLHSLNKIYIENK